MKINKLVQMIWGCGSSPYNLFFTIFWFGLGFFCLFQGAVLIALGSRVTEAMEKTMFAFNFNCFIYRGCFIVFVFLLVNIFYCILFCSKPQGGRLIR